MIDIGIGKENGRNRRLPFGTARVQLRRGKDLLAQIRRSIQKQPALPVRADSQRGLASRLDTLIPAPGELAVGTEAIPLGKATARS